MKKHFRVELEEGLERVEKEVSPLREVLKVQTPEALGFVLSESIFSPLDIPPFNKSPLDGFAVRSEDTSSGGASFKIIDSIVAGEVSKVKLGPNEAVRLMTGAKMPEGANTVIRLENAEVESKSFTSSDDLRPYSNYIFQGEDIKKGEEILKEGDKISSVEIAMLASMGIKSVNVYKKPSLALVSTGDEIVALGDSLEEGKIYDSNLEGFTARFKELGFFDISREIVKDDKASLEEKFKSLSQEKDLIVSTGGVSVGDKDYMEEILNKLGASFIFQKVNMKPGGHMYMAKLNKSIILALSGNPFAAMATFEIFARKALGILANDKGIAMEKCRGVLENDFPKKSKGRRLIRALSDMGRIYLPSSHDSGVISSARFCNCLVDIPGGSDELKAGSEVSYWL